MKRFEVAFMVSVAALALIVHGCSSAESADSGWGDGGIPDSGGVADAGHVFDPYLVRTSSEIEPLRGYVIKQGHIHAHNVFSHDACDGMPRENGETGPRNEECYQDLRTSLCKTKLDFMFMTDHTSGMFCEFEYPEELYYEPGSGDKLIERDGLPSANLMACPDGRKIVLSAGFDGEMMVIGLERHARSTPEERHTLYGSMSLETIKEVQKYGALVAAAYASDWDEKEILKWPWQGYEVYNPATNLREREADLVLAVGQLYSEPETLPAPELFLMMVFEEGEKNVRYWANIILQRPLFNYIGPNVHRNVFAKALSDGERLDSYRRLFKWYSNFVLIPKEEAAAADDRTYKAAFNAGHLYNAFTLMGYPVGFDFHAVVDGKVYEMGAHIPAGVKTTFNVKVPTVWGRLAPGAEEPEITAKILRARVDGWDEVASGTKDFSWDVTGPGAYRVDVKIIPKHLKPWLGRQWKKFYVERSWVYSNPIYVGMEYETALCGGTGCSPSLYIASPRNSSSFAGGNVAIDVEAEGRTACIGDDGVSAVLKNEGTGEERDVTTNLSIDYATYLPGCFTARKWNGVVEGLASGTYSMSVVVCDKGGQCSSDRAAFFVTGAK